MPDFLPCPSGMAHAVLVCHVLQTMSPTCQIMTTSHLKRQQNPCVLCTYILTGMCFVPAGFQSDEGGHEPNFLAPLTGAAEQGAGAKMAGAKMGWGDCM